MAKKIHLPIGPIEPIGSLPDYLQYVEEQCTGERNVLFRGHTNRKWRLEPKIARLTLRPRLSLPTSEIEMFREFKRQALPHVARDFGSDWDWLALAQHHGLPTRLLDWTTNGLAALWFAIERPPQAGENGSVWIFFARPDDYADDEKIKSPLDAPRTLVFRPRHLTPRIVAQSGWFTVHPFIPDRRGFVLLEKNNKYKARLKKVEILRGCFPALREDLSRCGINAGALFGDLNGISRTLTWGFSPLDDESDYDSPD